MRRAAKTSGKIKTKRVKRVILYVNNNEHQEPQELAEPLKLPYGVWGDICRQLIETCGVHVYNNWCSRLTPIIDEHNRTIELKAPNSFIGQWIETNYGDKIQEILKKLGFDLKMI